MDKKNSGYSKVDMTWWVHAAEMALNVSCSHMISNKGGNVGVYILYKSQHDRKVVLWIIWDSGSKIDWAMPLF